METPQEIDYRKEYLKLKSEQLKYSHVIKVLQTKIKLLEANNSKVVQQRDALANKVNNLEKTNRSLQEDYDEMDRVAGNQELFIKSLEAKISNYFKRQKEDQKEIGRLQLENSALRKTEEEFQKMGLSDRKCFEEVQECVSTVLDEVHRRSEYLMNKEAELAQAQKEAELAHFGSDRLRTTERVNFLEFNISRLHDDMMSYLSENEDVLHFKKIFDKLRDCEVSTGAKLGLFARNITYGHRISILCEVARYHNRPEILPANLRIRKNKPRPTGRTVPKKTKSTIETQTRLTLRGGLALMSLSNDGQELDEHVSGDHEHIRKYYLYYGKGEKKSKSNSIIGCSYVDEPIDPAEVGKQMAKIKDLGFQSLEDAGVKREEVSEYKFARAMKTLHLFSTQNKVNSNLKLLDYDGKYVDKHFPVRRSFSDSDTDDDDY